MVAEAAAYERAGGHSAIRERIHDGLALPRAFRVAGLRTDLFDATDLATCRMYRSAAEVWHGFAKNTHEGLGAPALIVPATLALIVGQVLPFLLLFVRGPAACIAAGACAIVLSTRIALGARFRQPFVSALLHPLAIVGLLAIQWTGLVRWLMRKPARWKSREYLAASAGDRVPLADAEEQRPERV
ncbi:MAG: hypothetical protein M3Z36_01905 [Acidobacteriota bacterium]|nr:hypothetical protein [Acidobacteriota bacterium]